MTDETHYPSATAAVLATMREESERRRDRGRRLLDDAHQAKREHGAAETALHHLTGLPGVPGFEGQPTTRSQIAAAQAKVAEKAAEEARRFELYRAHGADSEPATLARTRCEAYLKQADVTGRPLLPHTGRVKTNRRSGESTLAAVTRVRAEIETLKIELAAVAARPLPSRDAKAAARAHVEEVAASNVPNLAPLFAGTPFKLPVFDLRRGYYNRDTVASDVPDTHSLFAWVFKDAIIAKLEAAIDATADDRKALTADQKVAETKRVEAAILATERVEAALIEAAHDEGQTIPRRTDADPRATLWLASSMPVPA